ncbi:radical SAM/SPASM domain-containing protein [Penaeicola halotolerans]|uniref:radical SAM/SPASM domain-containing protein n=1 Tax=Penaeicola halotolerans TaxID=2793196 RepID=UPI001CF921C3|nr:radical SAM/SPASM domain-containing protein [Penaeicola halotolerans]
MGSWKDTKQLIKKMRPLKAWQLLKLYTTYYLSKTGLKLVHAGLPVSMSIEPTTSCNLRCPECPSGLRSFSRPTGLLDQTFFRQVIDQTKDHLLYLNLYFQGEPYLHPQFLDLVSYATSNGIYTNTSTNAHFLNEEKALETVKSGLDRLIISIDGTSQDTYASYRVGGRLDKVIAGAKAMVKAKKELKSHTPHIVFQFLVVGPNEHQIEEVKALAKEIGVDEVTFKTAQIYDYEHGSPLIPKQERYARYRQTSNGKWQLKYKLEDACWRMWQGTVITWDGKVVPCCFDKDASHQLGDLQTETLASIWQSNRYEDFRKAVFTDRASIDICRNCSEGSRILLEA